MARILFVDDDTFTLDTYKRAAEIIGHEALLAFSPRGALDLAAEQLPDLIVVDMRMPGMDGLDLLSCLHEDETTSHIPTVMVSAGPEIDVAEIAQKAGAKAYLSKPIRLDQLHDAIQKYALK